jgi:hypothetical protein
MSRDPDLCGVGCLRLGHADDAASYTSAGVAGRLGFEIIGFLMDDDSVSEN